MKKTLPEKYYLTHFHEFLSFFSQDRANLLDDDSVNFIASFNQLPEPQQCIIARAANRKYALINRHHFNYQEISLPQMHIDTLIQNGWFGDISEASRQDLHGVVTKSEILNQIKATGFTQFTTSQRKSELIAAYFQHQEQHKDQHIDQHEKQIKNNHCWPATACSQHYLFSRFYQVLKYLLFLFFGHTKGELKQFTLRDLGIMRTRSNTNEYASHFDTLQDAQAAFFYAQGIEQLKQTSVCSIETLAEQELPLAETSLTQKLADEFQYRVGVKLLSTNRAAGVAYLSVATGDMSKEKWIRESFKDGNTKEVKAALDEILSTPHSESLLLFAEDFYARKFNHKRTSTHTDILRNASISLQVDESFKQNVEQGVVSLYKREGKLAFRTENILWRTFFGLTYWQLLFEKHNLVTEFEFTPKSIKNETFYSNFASEIEALLHSFNSSESVMKHLISNATRNYGKVNFLFQWQASVIDLVKLFVLHTPVSLLVSTLLAMAKDFQNLKDGFPDIMVIENGVLRFEEVKAQGDQLRRNQLITIQKLQQLGFTVQITRVSWYSDPLQPYVVVDVETTGGKSDYHRITEIGMVKLINGVVIDEWHSLINPMRPIPKFIKNLTGITDEMVETAPTFAELADEIDRFTDGCIFVAHNVNFDYGFFKREFERQDKLFKRTKLCTVTECRKAFPGLKSYSLANLTQHFDIRLNQHHRALDDAKAAAELFLLARQNA